MNHPSILSGSDMAKESAIVPLELPPTITLEKLILLNRHFKDFKNREKEMSRLSKTATIPNMIANHLSVNIAV